MKPEFVFTGTPDEVESVVLDPSDIATAGRVELPLEGNGLKIHEEGIDWGDQAVKAFLAEGNFGEPMIDYIVPNRTIKIPLIISTGETASFDEVRESLQAKVALINDEKCGWIKRTLSSGAFAFADLVEAKLHLGDDWLVAKEEVDRLATLEFQALPDFYGDLIEGEAHEATGDLAWTEKPQGTLPARVESLAVTDESGNAQRGLMWHFRAKHYDSAATANWTYNAEALELLDLAEKVTLAGSAGSKVVKHPKLSTSWTPILGTTLTAGTHLTHRGLYTVWARVYSTSGELPWLRLLWDVGDIMSPSENSQIQIPGKSNFYLVPLGQINLQKMPVGTHRWKGVIQGRGEVGGENISIDRLYFECADESSSVERASTVPSLGGATYAARDEFNQAGSALTGNALPVGGNWTNVAEDDTDDFAVSESSGGLPHLLTRSLSGGDTANKGRLVSAGTTNYPSAMAQLDWRMPTIAGTNDTIGFHMRLTDIKNHLRVVVQHKASSPADVPGTFWVKVEKRVASVNTVIAEKQISSISANTWYTLTAMVDASGRVLVWRGPSGGNPELVLACQDNTLKTGETLATGKIGLYEERLELGSVFVYDNFKIWVPELDAVLFPNKNVQISTDGSYRQTSDGAAYGPVANPGADLPRLPVSGPEERLVEIALKGSQGNLELLPDSGRDLIQGQITYRACWSYLPGS